MTVPAMRRIKLPHIHWWRYNGWDIGRGGLYFCRCGRMEHGPVKW